MMIDLNTKPFLLLLNALIPLDTTVTKNLYNKVGGKMFLSFFLFSV